MDLYPIRIFIYPEIPNSLEGFLHGLIILMVYGFISYLATVILVNLCYQEKDIMDADTRYHLCWMWGICFSMILLTINIVWVWLANNYNVWTDFTSHWGVMIVLLIIWITLYFSLKNQLKPLKRAQTEVK